MRKHFVKNTYFNGVSVFGNAKYIKAQERPSEFSFYDPAPLFRREFDIDALGEARIFVQSPGFARYYINGEDITEDLFISAVSDYTKILWYNEYDVTHLLRKGKNTICVIVGNGFFNESFESAWHYPTATWRDAPQFCLRLTVNCETVLVSDSSFKCSQNASYIVYNHLRSGEYWDMRKKDDSWMSIGYDDSEWSYAIELENKTDGIFKPVCCQPVREAECIEPCSTVKTERGYLVDFGVNISGYTEVCLREARGSEITFRYTEEIDEQGYPKYNRMDSPSFFPESPFQMNKIIASGETDVIKPLFSYHGFRYVLIEGVTDEPISVCAYFTHNDVRRTSSFESGNNVLNYIYNAGIRSTYSNMFWCLTDCPTREKLGWTNDAQASVEQTLINFDIVPLYEKWIEDIKASMFDDGSLHGTIPSTDWEWGHACGPVCDCLIYELPYKIYLYTGRADALIDTVEYLERYAEFLECKINEDYDFVLGDWLGYANSELIPKEFVRDFYLIKALKVTTLANKISGKDYGVWQQKLDNYTESFKNRYLDEAGRCIVEEQCSIAMMLVDGLYTNESALAEQLVSVLYRDGFRLTCGMVGVQYLYDAIARAGRADIAYKMIPESDPGYKTWFENGATTLWERWDGKDRGSHNHHMFSGVIAWFYKYLLGIAPTEESPAFETLELCPCFIKEAGYVKGEIDTVRGKISAEWRIESDGFVYEVSIPQNINATFRGEKLKAGNNKFFIQQEDVQ